MAKQKLTVGESIEVGTTTITVVEISRHSQGSNPPEQVVTVEIVEAGE